jgi:hypothetical protein
MGLPAVFNIAIPENIIGYQRLLAYAESNRAQVGHLVVGICMENDLRDYSEGKSAADRDFGPRVQASKKERFRAWVQRRSALWVAASHILQRYSFMRRILEKVGIARNIHVSSGKNEWNEKALQTSRDEVLKLVLNRDALILIIPARHLWHGDNISTENRVHEAFVRSLREAGLNVLDLKPVLEQSGAPLSHYFKTDPHWNAQGHAVAARELFKAIRSREQKQNQ